VGARIYLRPWLAFLNHNLENIELRKAKYIAFVTGFLVSVALIIFFRAASLTFDQMRSLSYVVLPFWPTAPMLDVNPNAGLADKIGACAIVSTLNGLWYLAVVAAFGRLLALLNKWEK
jgi:hypothetical protein